jgi:hypothetical protein
MFREIPKKIPPLRFDVEVESFRCLVIRFDETRADFDRLESSVGWAKARSSRRAHADLAMVGTLRFAHPTRCTDFIGIC